MFNSLLLDSNDSVIADRLSRLQDSLRGLTLSTREEYQAAVYSMVNTVLNLGDNMQTLTQIRSKPAIVGDLSQNLTLLNQDSNDIAAEILQDREQRRRPLQPCGCFAERTAPADPPVDLHLESAAVPRAVH